MSALNLPQTRFSRWVDALVERVGRAISWLWITLLGTIALNVFMRYALGEGRIEFEELQWHLYATGFMLGLGYALKEDAHVRVDVLHERFSPTLKAWTELYGLLLLLAPFIALMLIYAVPFIADSFAAGEVSPSPGGLTHRWIIKSVLFVGMALLGLAAAARLTRVWKFLFFGKDGAG